ncbi:EAL domain-containing protein [Schinkia azotoformans MEV2011]|uniref:EAL domain-containing protein n=1 Tax=Schinkia azotoformans MEV2011 TaxID=1348973 RepID=A0A072P0U8_SCHAZ|nr:EAL domain-containing protein [Schinkia azotoformans MEV2011]
MAEETGLILDIGEWVLETVCLQIQKWRLAGIKIPKIAVNLSPIQLMNANLLKMTKHIIDKTNIDPTLIGLEITENISLFQKESAIHIITSLKKQGFKILIDDFGKGHSNLSYIQQLPIDSIKIDRSFISDIPQNKNNIALTKAMIAMAHELQLTVVAEGVETKEQLEFLDNHNCDYAQGFYLSRALPSEEIVKLLLTVNDEYQLAL